MYNSSMLGSLPHGCFVEPTLVSVRPGQALWRDEVFGPVLSVTTVGGFDEAVRLTNDSSYGLAAAVFTMDLRRANEFIDQAETGQVAVNLPTSGWDVHHPFGGFHESGSPFREQGASGLRFYPDQDRGSAVLMVTSPVGIIGAGLIGLATARQLVQSGVPVVVWEKEPAVARHQSGHNSGVVHAGIYYPSLRSACSAHSAVHNDGCTITVRAGEAPGAWRRRHLVGQDQQVLRKLDFTRL